MYLRTNETQRSFRDVRAHLAEVCDADHATLILDFYRPRAILVPIKLQGRHSSSLKDKGIAKAERDFAVRIGQLRRQ